MAQQPAYAKLLERADELEDELVINRLIFSSDSDQDQTNEVKTRRLKKAIDAIRNLLSQIKKEALEHNQRVLDNMEDQVLPYLVRLGETDLDTNQAICLNVAQTNLAELGAPFMLRLEDAHPRLTKRECEVANLVRLGHTSREIAEVLKITKRAVEFHRDRLREKMGLKNQKKNLRTYLLSIG